MQGNMGKIIILGVLVAAGFGAWKYFAKNVGSKSDAQLFDLVAAGGMTATAAESELMMRAGSGKTAGPVFRAKLKAPAKEVRVVACKGVKATKDKDAVKGLLEALGDDAFEVRAAACEAFEDIRVKEAVPPLLKLLDDTKEAVRVAASSALRSITRMNYSNKEVDKWRNWWADNGKLFEVKE